MGERPSKRQDSGLVEQALGTSALGNSTAFGFSIMITASFGMLSKELGPPTVFELFIFGAGAATGVALIEGLVTRGFRRRVDSAASEVTMLGTALNFISVTISIAAAYGVTVALSEGSAWAIGAFVAAALYVLSESAEILVAELVQSQRGDPDAPDGR